MKVLYYYTRDHFVPVKEDLDELERERPEEWAAVARKFRLLKKLSVAEAFSNGHIEHVRDKVSKVKIRGHQTRILGFMWQNCWVAAVHTIKKQDALDDRDIDLATRRRDDWYERA